MSTYRFLGTEADIPGFRTLRYFGQSIDLPDDLANELILGAGKVTGNAGAIVLLPESEFERLDFSPEELKHFATPASQSQDQKAGDAVLSLADFQAKKHAAFEALSKYRDQLEDSNAS
jgi:hypothetical protein